MLCKESQGSPKPILINQTILKYKNMLENYGYNLCCSNYGNYFIGLFASAQNKSYGHCSYCPMQDLLQSIYLYAQ